MDNCRRVVADYKGGVMRIYRISSYDGEEHKTVEINLSDVPQWGAIREFLQSRNYKKILHTIAEMKEDGKITREICFDSQGNTDLNKMDPVARELVKKFDQRRHKP